MLEEVPLCASGEGESCRCTNGYVYYGERYQRQLDNNNQSTEVDTDSELDLITMLQYPYLVKDMSDGGIMTQCSFGQFGKEISEFPNSYVVRTDKQCFCMEQPIENWNQTTQYD